jgi:hypothetical protein
MDWWIGGLVGCGEKALVEPRRVGQPNVGLAKIEDEDEDEDEGNSGSNLDLGRTSAWQWGAVWQWGLEDIYPT